MTLAMLSPPPCANKVIRIELREADAQEELRQDAEQLKSMTLGVDPLPKAMPAPILTSSPALQARFLEGTPRWLGTDSCGKEATGALPITKGQRGQHPPGWRTVRRR